MNLTQKETAICRDGIDLILDLPNLLVIIKRQHGVTTNQLKTLANKLNAESKIPDRKSGEHLFTDSEECCGRKICVTCGRFEHQPGGKKCSYLTNPKKQVKWLYG